MVSDAIKEALENKTERVIKLIWEDGSITEPDDIAGESMTIEQVLCDSGGILYGQCNASKFKIKIKRENCAGTTFEVRCYFTGTEGYLQLGRYTVDSAGKKNQRNFREIIAYDDMRRLQRDVSDWYNNLKLAENTITQAEMLKSLLTYCGITYNESEIDGIVNAAVSVEETIAPSKLQGMQVAEKILEINGVFGTIDWAGTFRIVNMLNRAAEQIDQNRYYTCDYEEYTVKEVNALQLRGEEGDIGYVIEAPEGVKENGYIVTDNFLIYGKSKEELKIIGDNLFKMIKGLTYCPVKLSTRNITYLHMGDYIDIDTGDDIISSVIMKRTIKGIHSFRETLTAEGDEYFNYDIEGSNLEIEQLRGKTNILSRTVEGTLSKVEEISKEMGTVSTTIQQLAGQIITEVTSEGEVQSRFSQELGKFLFEGKWFYIHTDNVTIDGTTFKVDNGYIGGLRIGSEGLSSDDYTTLQIFKDGTGKFTNLYACGQGYIDLTSRHPTDEEKDIESFFRTTDGCLMTYDTVHNVTTAIYIDEKGNAVFAKCRGMASNIAEIKSRMIGQLTIGDDEIQSSLDFTAPNLGKGSYGMIQAVDFKTTPSYLPTSDNFRNYIDFNAVAVYKEKTASVVNAAEYVNSQGYKYVVGAYTNQYGTVHFLASKYQCSGIVIKNCDTDTKQIWCGTYDGTNIRGYEIVDIQGNDTDGYNIYSIYKNTIGSFLASDDKLPATYTAEIASVGKFTLYSTGRPYVKLICEDNTTKEYTGDAVKNGYSILRYNHAEVARLQIITPQFIVKYAENSKNEAYEARTEVRIIAGENITISDVINGIKINATVPQASETQAGSMSSSDKAKLDGIQAGAEQNVQADWNADDTSSDEYIKNKPTSMPASDVYDWAKQPSKPAYTAEEVGADASGTGAVVYDQAKKYTDNAVADAFKNTVTGIKGSAEALYRTGDVEITKENINLGNVDNTSDTDKPISNMQRKAIDEAYANSNKYTDEKISELIGGAPETLDTLKEVADAINESKSVEEALNKAIGTKANQTELDTHTDNDTIHIVAEERSRWNDANDKKHVHANKSVLDRITTDIINAWNNVINKLDKTGDASDTTATFTQATARVNITSGEKLSVMFGKVAKWLADLKTVAFSGSYNDLNDTPASLPANGGNAATATKLATARYINGASFDGTKDIQLPIYFSNKFGATGNTIKYAVFCKMKKDNLYGEGETTMLLTAHGNFGGTIAGTYLVSISNRGGKVTMRVIALQQENGGQDTTEFGWYEDDDYFYCGVKRPTYSYSENITVFSRSGGFIAGIILDTATEPAGWTKVGIYKLAKTTDTVSKAYALDSSAGSATQPVYFKDGKPVAVTYGLNKTVPADAKFTDTDTWRGIQNNLTSDSTVDSLAAAQGKILNTRIDVTWEKLQSVSGDHIFWEQIGVSSSKINTYNGYYVRHGQIVVYAATFVGGGSTSTEPTQIITGLPAPICWTALSVMINGDDNSAHEAYLDTDGSIYMKNITGMQVFISGAYICST